MCALLNKIGKRLEAEVRWRVDFPETRSLLLAPVVVCCVSDCCVPSVVELIALKLLLLLRVRIAASCQWPTGVRLLQRLHGKDEGSLQRCCSAVSPPLCLYGRAGCKIKEYVGPNHLNDCSVGRCGVTVPGWLLLEAACMGWVLVMPACGQNCLLCVNGDR